MTIVRIRTIVADKKRNTAGTRYILYIYICIDYNLYIYAISNSKKMFHRLVSTVQKSDWISSEGEEEAVLHKYIYIYVLYIYTLYKFSPYVYIYIISEYIALSAAFCLLAGMNISCSLSNQFCTEIRLLGDPKNQTVWWARAPRRNGGPLWTRFEPLWTSRHHNVRGF